MCGGSCWQARAIYELRPNRSAVRWTAGVPAGTPVDSLSPGHACESANSANAGASDQKIRKIRRFARAPGFSCELEARIRAMAVRWKYTSDDLADALEDAHTNPAAWLSACDQDEQRAAKLA